MKSNSNGHFNEETASIIKSHAKCSVGIADISFNIHIPQLIESIEFLNTQIKIIEKEIDKILKEINSVILSIPGISNNACASILGEIGNISNFSKPSKLLAFAGLDPKVRQSGNFNAISCRMSKRGSKYLRYSLIYTAWNVVRNNKTFQEYYLLKRSQGKTHYKALGHVSHKLVRIIFKLLKYNVPFDDKLLV